MMMSLEHGKVSNWLSTPSNPSGRDFGPKLIWDTCIQSHIKLPNLVRQPVYESDGLLEMDWFCSDRLQLDHHYRRQRLLEPVSNLETVETGFLVQVYVVTVKM